MNIRTAILKAADSIERNPKLFGFGICHVPSCGSPGCLIGLVGQQMGISEGAPVGRTCMKVFGIGEKLLYDRIKDIDGSHGWTNNPEVAAHCLRKYADKYHPVQGIPESILAIFNEKAVA